MDWLLHLVQQSGLGGWVTIGTRTSDGLAVTFSTAVWPWWVTIGTLTSDGLAVTFSTAVRPWWVGGWAPYPLQSPPCCVKCYIYIYLLNGIIMQGN